MKHARYATATATGAGPSLLSQEIGFRAWIDSQAKRDVIAVSTGTEDYIALIEALPNLLQSSEPLAPAYGHTLGLDDTATIATAAAQLLWAHSDPAGPRCRSFRSASMYLVGMAALYPDDMLIDRVATAGTR